MNDTDKIIIKVVGIILLLSIPISGGWWYVSKKRECVGRVYYQPPREQSDSKWTTPKDKGDYYWFGQFGGKYKTSEDAIRACMWE